MTDMAAPGASTEAGGRPSAPRGGSSGTVVLGVAGGIAAYKAAELLRRFTESGHDVTVVPTAAALRFVGAPTNSRAAAVGTTVTSWPDSVKRRSSSQAL